MPKAPEYTRKEQKQRNKQWAKEAHERGAIQEFPGAPIWNDWLKEQHEAKKRQIGLPRRIGRAAVEMAAVSILAAREVPIALTDHRQRRNAQIAERQRKIVERSKSAKAIPNTDLRKVNKSKIRKAAVEATSAKNRYDERLLESSSSAAERLSAKNNARRQRKLGRLATWASNKLGKIDKKRMDTHMRRQEQFEAEKDVAWGKYLKENPEVEKRLIAEQIERNRQAEVSAVTTLHREAFDRAHYAIEYLRPGTGPKGKDAYSFSKSIPRRPAFDGSYDELAKNTLSTALTERQEDGVVPLFKPNLVTSTIDNNIEFSPPSLEQNLEFHLGTYNGLLKQGRDRNDYVGGVSTMVWKLGFVDFESEKDIPYGKGEFNPDAEWSRGDDGTTFASIPFNPENELHRMIAGEHADPATARVQLAINDSQRYAPELNLSLVEQPALVHSA